MNLEQYFSNLVKNESLPSGYHDLKYFRSDTSILNIEFTCTTDLGGINKVITKIFNMYSIINEDVLKILRHIYLEYDFLTEDFIYNKTKIIFKYKIIKTYLNLAVLPSDIIYEIIKYLDKLDYFNLIEVIKLREYPSLIDKLKITKGNETWTLTNKGYPAIISIDYYFDTRIRSKSVHLLNGFRLYTEWYDNRGRIYDYDKYYDGIKNYGLPSSILPDMENIRGPFFNL